MFGGPTLRPLYLRRINLLYSVKYSCLGLIKAALFFIFGLIKYSVTLGDKLKPNELGTFIFYGSFSWIFLLSILFFLHTFLSISTQHRTGEGSNFHPLILLIFYLLCQVPSRSARRKKAKRRWLRELKLAKEKVIWFHNLTVEVVYLLYEDRKCVTLTRLMTGNLLTDMFCSFV